MTRFVRDFSGLILDSAKYAFLIPLEIKSLNYAATYRCNSHCVMCNIWKKDLSDKELSLEEVKLFFSNALLKNLSAIQLTGGECFLRKDFVDLVSTIVTVFPQLKLVVSSNGFLTDKIVSSVGEILEFHNHLLVAISVDGSQRTHDEIRGTQGAYDWATATLIGLKGKCDVQVSFTATPQNYQELVQTKSWAENQGFKFAFQVMNTSDGYFSNAASASSWSSLDRQFLTSICRQIKSELSSYDSIGNFWIDGIINKLNADRKMMNCFAGYSSLYLDPYGSVYPCITSLESMGNMRAADLKEIWVGAKAKNVRKKVNRCSACWLGCEYCNNIAHSFRKYLK